MFDDDNEKNGKFENAWEKIKDGWDHTEDKSKDTWDNLVERVVDGFRDTSDWTDDKINEAKGYFKGRFSK